MKKSNLVRLFLVVIFSIIMIAITTQVLAAEDWTDIYAMMNGTGNSAVDGNNTNGQSNTPVNTPTNTPSALTTGNLGSNNTNANNTDTNLPDTGIADTMPIVVIVVVLGISSVYAYKKMKDYQDID